MTTAVPAPAPELAPIAAPFAPPTMAPRIAPATAPPPIFAALLLLGASPKRVMASVLTGRRVPSARTSVWKRIPRRARSLNLPPRSTNVTDPSALAPAGMASSPSARTSRTTRASTRSSTRACSLEIVESSCKPITESAETTTSSNTRAGGSGARGSSTGAGGSACATTDWAGAGDVDVLLGQLRSSAGVWTLPAGPTAWVLARGAVVDAAWARRLGAVRVEAAGASTGSTATGLVAGAAWRGASPTTASVSCTARVGGVGATMAACDAAGEAARVAR